MMSQANKKRGSIKLPLFRMAELCLERIAPVEKDIDPVAAFARPTIRRRAPVDFVAESEVITGLSDAVIKITRVIPQDIGTHAHARCDDIPQIPLSQKNSVSVELIDTSADVRGTARYT